jgi:hypothetical protein
MSKLITGISCGATIYVTVPNDVFDEIRDEVGEWADSPNQVCTTIDSLYELAHEESEFAMECVKMVEAKFPELDYGDVVIQKEDPK